MGLCIKVERGHRDACVGTWDLRTRDEGLEDIKYGTRGRVGRGRQKTGTQGTRNVKNYCKSPRGKCVTFLVNMFW